MLTKPSFKWPKKRSQNQLNQNHLQRQQPQLSPKAAKVKSHKYVYDFGKKTDGDAKQRELLGGKGANLAEMAKIGLPVPPGFTISTEVCTYFYKNSKKYPKVLDDQMKASVALMEKQAGQEIG
jgi:pyruvate,orthophosphate dikinase